MATSSKKRSSTRKSGTGGGADRADKSVEAFRDALERSVTLSRERIQEVVDDAVKRGRMTRKDANELVSKLVTRGRKQTEDLLKELERTWREARKELEDRAKQARREVETQARRARREAEAQVERARKRAGRAASRAGRGARDVADEPLAQADKARRKAGVGPSFPITAYDELTAAQVKSRLSDLSKPELRKVRTHEKRGKARKSVLAEIEKKLS